MTASRTHGDFSHGDVSRLILSQSVPLILAQLVQLLYNIVDRIYIGHMPGADADLALTGLGLCFPVITLISACVNLIATGAAPLCSMARGEGNLNKAHAIMQTAYTALLMISVFIMALMYVLCRPLLYLLGASDATWPYACQYLNIYLVGTVFFAIGTGMNNFINLQGYPTMGMLTTVIGAVLNLILDPVFIFGFGMGIKGAAIATVISQFCSACWVILYLHKDTLDLRLDPLHFEIVPDQLKRILTLGIPGFIMGATNCAVQAVCNAALSIYGGDLYIAVMTIINSVREIIMLPISGIAYGSQPVMSFNYGAGKHDRVKQSIRFTTFIALLYTIVFWLFTLCFPGLFLQMFSSDPKILEAGIHPLVVYFLGFLFMTLQFSGQCTFTALGKAKQAVFFSIFRKVIIVVPLTLLLPKIPALGAMGVFWAEPISNLIGGCASFSTMIFTVYRKL